MWQSSSCHVQQAQDGIDAPEKYRNIEDTNLRRRHPEKQHLCVQPSQKLPSSKKDSPFKASMCLAWLQGFSTSNGGYVRYLCQVHLAHHLLRVISGSARAAPMAKCTEHFKNHDSSGGRRGVGPRQKARLFVTEGIWQRKPRFNKQGLYAWLWSGHLYIYIYITYDVNIKSVTCGASCRAGERRPYKSFSARAIILRWILNAQFCLLTFKIWI